MKRSTVSIGILFFLLCSIFAQAPQSFKYQAIARNADGAILSNQNISLRISILYGNTTSVAMYTEIHNVRTSPFGLINMEIGNGENKSGDFSAIDWSKGTYYVNIEIDENGGSDYVSMGSSQLLSVPYALYAEESGSSSSSGSKEADSWTEGTGVTYLTNPNNVGIGTTAPVSKLHVTGTGVNAIYERNISTAAGPANRFYKSRGSESSKTQIQSSDNMGQFQFWGMGDDGAYDIGATIKGVAESTRTGTDLFDVGASIQFLTTNTAFSWGERMRITADGDVGIGTTDPAGILDIAGAYHFPSTDGTSGQVLRTDGGGTLSWASGGAQEINDLSDGKTENNSVYLGSGAGGSGTGGFNVAIGFNALNVSGGGAVSSNTVIGYDAGWNGNGDYSTAIGCEAAKYYLGIKNTSIGYRANYYGGSENTCIGYEAGCSTNYIEGNIMIGYQAGKNETGNDKLYIENSSSSSPLIYGEFDNDIVRINGNLEVTGIIDKYSIGDFAQGGIVFLVDESGQHGLVCAKTDQSSGIRWYAGTYGYTDALGDGPYSGEMNTSIIIAAHTAIGKDGGTYAARVCAELIITEGGKAYGDWYLPSKEELNLMYINKSIINTTAIANGGVAFATTSYWSSTEYNLNQAWLQGFYSGNQYNYNKDTPGYVRAIRAF